MSVATIMLAAAAAYSASYDCTLEVPKALRQTANAVELRPINFPGVAEGAWKFRLDVQRDKKGLFATVIWPGDPIQLAGRHPGMPTAEGAMSFAPFSTGPCMFTETGCLSLVNLVEKPDGTAKIIVTPAALGSDKAANTRDPFVVVIEGTCARTEASK